jgi:cellulose synthase/poly-beta-1,6-N-acetylglucosamine synthase-like glycosyltransferase
MRTLLTIVNTVVLGYFALISLNYIALTALAFRSLRGHAARAELLQLDDLSEAGAAIPVSIIVPAFDEGATIVDSVRSLVTLDYPEYEIVVVNDGSRDDTLARLTDYYALDPGHRLPTSTVPTARIRAVYRSRRHPNLWVVDKENGGKADALNTGVNYSRYPLFCAMDADSLLERDALSRITAPFLTDRRTVAAGGIIRIANGSRVTAGMVTDVRLPDGLLVRFQVLEYLRAFLAGRVGWDAVGGSLVISGGFGVFRRKTVADAGGFATDTVGEDMELVVRLHRHCRDRGIPYRIAFVPDPVAWTEAPADRASLRSQRDRWQRGLAQTLARHRGMLFRPRYGTVGMAAMPAHVAFELIGPVVEGVGYLALALSIVLGVANPAFIVAFLVLAVFLGAALSVVAVGLEELNFHRYERRRDLATLLGLALIESFGYRQLTTVWRIRGLWSALRKKAGWGVIGRQGFSTTQPPSDGSASTREAAAPGAD